MLYARQVAVALVGALLVAIGTVACSVKQSADKLEQSLEMKYPEKDKKE